MNTRLLVPLLVVGAFAFACSPRPHTEASEAKPVAITQQGAPRTAAKSVTRTKPKDGAVTTSLVVLRDGKSLRFALDVVNAGNKRIELAFPDGQTHDVVVVDSVGREVWRWGQGRMFTQAMRTSALDGGDTLRISERWEAPAAQGTLTAIATLRSTSHPVERRIDFRVQ